MPGGRPSVLDRVLRIDPITSERVTVADQILHDLRNGAYIETACANVGIHKDTYFGWRKIAAQLRLANAGQLPKRMSAHERRCVEFSDAVDEADASFERDILEVLGVLGRGGYQTTKTVIKRGPPTLSGDAGPVLESTTTTERLAPSVPVLLWRLSRKFPNRYGNRVEVTGVEGGPVMLSMDERAEGVAATLEAFLQGADAARSVKAKRSGKAAGEPDPASSP